MHDVPHFSKKLNDRVWDDCVVENILPARCGRVMRPGCLKHGLGVCVLVSGGGTHLLHDQPAL